MRLRTALWSVMVVAVASHVATAQVVVTGSVTDSMSRRPLGGAIVQMQRDSAMGVATAISDSLGMYRLENLAPGRYIAGFFHPRLDSLGIALSPRRLEIGAQPAQNIDFAVPSAKTIVAGLCPPNARSDSLGLLVGHVRDADSGLPRQGTVTVRWMELVISTSGLRRERRLVPLKTDAEGWFAFCGLPADAEITASAQADESESGWIEVRLTPGGLSLRDFQVSLADSIIPIFADSTGPITSRQRLATLRRGRARVEGTVQTSKGKPVANADVSVPGTGLSSRTLEGGAFALANLPSGTQTVEVRAIGYEPKRVTVDLSRDHPATVGIVLDRPVQMLDIMKVYGKGTASFAAFERRRRAGWGHFLTPVDIQRRNAMRVSELLRAMPGVRVVPGGGFGDVVLVRNCLPTVYVNGMRMLDDAARDLDLLASPSELTAVEVYTASSRPAEFWGNNCGTIVLWAGTTPR